MNYSLYINTVLILVHCVFAIHTYGRVISILTCHGTKIGTRNEWQTHRTTALVLALCVPMCAALMIYINLKLKQRNYYFMFFYPYDKLQYQECDDTHLVDIWVGERSVAKRVKIDWRKLNGDFKDFGIHKNVG